METNKKIAWFIEPLDSHTNQVIARRLAELNEIADSTNSVQMDVDGREHSVYQLSSHQRVTEVCKGRQEFQLKFKVYTKTGSAPLRESVIDSDEFKRKKKQKKIISKAGLKK